MQLTQDQFNFVLTKTMGILGISRVPALAIMANMQAESALDPYRVQGDSQPIETPITNSLLGVGLVQQTGLPKAEIFRKYLLENNSGKAFELGVERNLNFISWTITGTDASNGYVPNYTSDWNAYTANWNNLSWGEFGTNSRQLQASDLTDAFERIYERPAAAHSRWTPFWNAYKDMIEAFQENNGSNSDDGGEITSDGGTIIPVSYDCANIPLPPTKNDKTPPPKPADTPFIDYLVDVVLAPLMTTKTLMYDYTWARPSKFPAYDCVGFVMTALYNTQNKTTFAPGNDYPAPWGKFPNCLADYGYAEVSRNTPDFKKGDVIVYDGLVDGGGVGHVEIIIDDNNTQIGSWYGKTVGTEPNTSLAPASGRWAYSVWRKQ